MLACKNAKRRGEQCRVCVSFAMQSAQLPAIKAVLHRLDKAFAAFFRRVTAGARPGYPRFQGRDRYDSFT